MFSAFLILLGGVSIFLYGLNRISKGTETIARSLDQRKMANLVKNPFCGTFLGASIASITQSSVAVSFITVSLVQSKVITFTSSAPIIMGANVGTTITAQLVSLTGSGGAILGSIASIIGLLASFCKNKRVNQLAKIAMGLGLIFAGLQIMENGILSLMPSKIFRDLFTAKNPFLLFLNGMVLTSIIQSSSALTGVLVILANNKITTFSQSVFVTLGSNVGSCFSVIIASMNKTLESRRASWFNLCFNLLGSMLFFPILLFFNEPISKALLKGAKTQGRGIANFHTLFNLCCSIIFLPFYKILTNVLSKIIKAENDKKSSKLFNKTFSVKRTRFN